MEQIHYTITIKKKEEAKQKSLLKLSHVVKRYPLFLSSMPYNVASGGEISPRDGLERPSISREL